MEKPAVAVLVVLLALGSDARAESDVNWLGGPVLGFAWGGDQPVHLMFGLEGGPGVATDDGFLRLNLGLEVRDGEGFVYAEGSGWLLLGISVGAGYATRTGVQGIGGVWEALPLDGWCSEGAASSLAFGYRYTGVHELFVTPKWGWSEQVSCPD